MIVEIKNLPFDDSPYRGFPVVHPDDRRIITEVEDGERCTTCILVKAAGLPLGQHFHTVDEPFLGRGSGKLYLVSAGGDLANPEVYDLPADGWAVTVPAGVTHAFVFDGEPDADGTIAVLVSDKTWKFNEDADKGEVNTYRELIELPTAA